MNKEKQNKSSMVSRSEVAQILGCSKRTVIRREAEGQLRPFRFGARMVRYQINEVEALIEKASANV